MDDFDESPELLEETLEAIENDNMTSVMGCLERGVVLSQRNKWGLTPLHMAAACGSPDITSLLLQHGAPLDAVTILGWSPLHDAASEGHLNVLKMLIDAQAIIDAENDEGDTPLHEAVREGHMNVVSELVDHGASLFYVNDNGDTPLHAAVGSGNLAMMKLLLDLGAPPRAKNMLELTPIDLAEQDGGEAAALLTQHAKIEMKLPKKGEYCEVPGATSVKSVKPRPVSMQEPSSEKVIQDSKDDPVKPNQNVLPLDPEPAVLTNGQIEQADGADFGDRSAESVKSQDADKNTFFEVEENFKSFSNIAAQARSTGYEYSDKTATVESIDGPLGLSLARGRIDLKDAKQQRREEARKQKQAEKERKKAEKERSKSEKRKKKRSPGASPVASPMPGRPQNSVRRPSATNLMSLPAVTVPVVASDEMFQTKSTKAAVQKSIRKSRRESKSKKRNLPLGAQIVTLAATPSGIDMKLGKDSQNRVRVCDTTPRGAADAVGINTGDIILEIGGRPVDTSLPISDVVGSIDANNDAKTELVVQACSDPVPKVSKLKVRQRTESAKGRGVYKTVVVKMDSEGEFAFEVLGPAESGGVMVKCNDPKQPVATGDVILGIMGEMVTPKNWSKLLYGMGPKITIDIMHLLR